MGEISIKIP